MFQFIEGTFLFHLPLERYTLPRQFVERFCDDRESRNKPPIVMARPMKLWSSLMSTGIGQVLTVSTLSGSVLMPSEETTRVGFSFRAAVRILSNNNRRRCRCSSREGAQIIISSKYARQCVEVRSLSATFINLVKRAGPLVSPKGITLHWNCPRWVENAVLSLSSVFTCTCRYPDARSRQENHWPPPSASKTSSVLADGICIFRCTQIQLAVINAHTVTSIMSPKQPDCSRGSATLQLYHSLAARPAVDV